MEVEVRERGVRVHGKGIRVPGRGLGEYLAVDRAQLVHEAGMR